MARGPLLFVAIAALVGCDQKRSAPTSAEPSATAAAPKPSSIERDERRRPPSDAGALKPGELADVGPAGPATASAHGVVMITKTDELVVARKDEASGTFDDVEVDSNAFRAYARGPAIAGDFAYWISKGRLVRKRIDAGSIETLADDARDGTRVAAVSAGSDKSGRGLAAYIARGRGATIARLWVERVGTWTLTPDGAAATSVSLTVSGNRAIAAALEGRTGMTPVHARVVELSGENPKLREDVVVWVAGPAQSHTEIATVTSDRAGVWAFIPLERDITRFGLAELELTTEPKMGTAVTWRGYPNGIDPAPIAAARACGTAFALYSMPAEAKPRSPQELVLSELGTEGLETANVVARSRAFSNVSLAAAAGGAIVSYVANRRTWATIVPCPR